MCDEYGLECNPTMHMQIFGVPSGTGAGIIYNGTRVSHIFCTIGRSKKYANLVTCDEVRYCYSPDGDANVAMAKAFEIGQVFPVKVAANGLNRNYFWGYGRIHKLTDATYAGGKRFIIRKVDHIDHLKHDKFDNSVWDAVVELHQRYALRNGPEEARVSSEDCNSAAPVAAPPASETHNDAAPVAAQPASTAGDEEASMVDTAPTLTAAQSTDGVRVARTSRFVRYKGSTFDSLLEARHAFMMDQLGMEYVRPAPTIHDLVVDGKRKSYSPDFYILDDGIYLEIKPCAPYDFAVKQCKALCQLMRAPVMLVYNTNFTCPFAKNAPPGKPGDYAHSNGIIGIGFRWDMTTRDVKIEHDITYMMDTRGGREVATLAARRGAEDMRVYHPKIVDAFDATASADFEDAAPSDFLLV